MTDDIIWHSHPVVQSQRAELKEQKPCVLWFTGLSASGKSTVAGALEEILTKQGYHTYLLDGDNVRHGLCKDLGFSEEDRKENIRRIGEVSKLMADAGLIVLASFISPFRADRQIVRDLLNEGEFIEVFVDASIEQCKQRDPKGLYEKAERGEIKQFTGIDSPYEAPVNAEIHLDTEHKSIPESVSQILEYLYVNGALKQESAIQPSHSFAG